MTKQLEGQTVVVTGASSGIGKATANMLAKQGAYLALVGRQEEELSKVSAQCVGHGVKVLPLLADITEKEQVEKIIRESILAFGKIDILVNNAGYGKYGSFTKMPIEEWDRMWLVNVRGTVLVTQAVVPFMISAKGGHIINISSIHGIDTSANASAYCATKFAVTGLTRALSKELYNHGIKVSMVCPGGVLTPFLGIKPEEKNQDFMEPEEVGKVVIDVINASGKALIQEVVVVPRNKPYTPLEIP
jgi:3-oxoacyl-[acyl-carrier protein] reductase